MSAATAVVQSVPVSPSVSVSLDRPLLRQADVVVGKDPGCAACSIAWSGSGFVASVQGGADTLDTAMASVDLGVGGWAARTYSRDLLGLPSGETLGGNLAVLQELDAKGNLIYELYLAGDRSLNLWSPAGGLRAASVNVSTGVIVPNNGSTVAVEVSAQANNSVIVRVNGSDRVTLTGFAGANTGNPRYLGAGVDHYDTKGTSDGKTVNPSQLGITTLGWLNARTS